MGCPHVSLSAFLHFNHVNHAIVLFKTSERAHKEEELFICIDIVYSFQVIAARKEEMEAHPGETMEKPDLLQKFISIYEEAGLSISNKDLFHQIFTFMIAGHETTSLVLTWTAFHLAKYHEFQPRLQKEIEEALDGRSEVTFDDLDKLRLLDHCIKETMRLFPVGIFVGREAAKEVKIGPYTIPRGTRVFVNFAALLRNPEHWKNPDEFDPDRFDVHGMEFFIHLK